MFDETSHPSKASKHHHGDSARRVGASSVQSAGPVGSASGGAPRREELRRFLTKHNCPHVDARQKKEKTVLQSYFVEGPEEFYPLHLAAKSGNAKMVSLLLRAGANQKQKTSKGRSVLEVAQEAECTDSYLQVLALLEENQTLGEKIKTNAQELRARSSDLFFGMAITPWCEKYTV